MIRSCESGQSPRGDGKREDKGLRVLLVEDNEVHELFMLVLLERDGHSVSVARNGAEALERFADELFDVILMDCKMPVLDGYEATRLIREREQGRSGQHVVIVGVSAATLKEEVERAYASGMDHFFSKPLRTQALRQLLAGMARALAEGVEL